MGFLISDKFATTLLFAFLAASSAQAAAFDVEKALGDRDACLIVADIASGTKLVEHNPTRCKERLAPCSSFKIAAALMAFEAGVLASEDQTIKWDGVSRDRKEINQDQTPLTWMSNSAMWVTQAIMPKIGMRSISKFLSDFAYGNQDFSGGITKAWQTSSLKISAYEQAEFVTKLWKEQLPLSKKTFERTRKVIFIKSLDSGASLYGKTGTGCIVGHECMSRPDRMLGWFVGVVKGSTKEYVFAANATDLKAEKVPAGPRLRSTVIEILNGLELPK